jgi:hypothetical protein
MTELLARTERSIESLTNNEKPTKLEDVRICVDLEQQLHQALNKLSSAQLIIYFTNSNQEGLQKALNKTLSGIISWYKANFLLLNFYKTYYLQFRTKNCIGTTLDINCFNRTIANFQCTKFLGLGFDNTLTWDNHTDQLISRSNSACYAIRAVKAMLSRKG